MNSSKSISLHPDAAFLPSPFSFLLSSLARRSQRDMSAVDYEPAFLLDVSAGSAGAHIYSGGAGASPIRRVAVLLVLVLVNRHAFARLVQRGSLVCRTLRYCSAAKAKDVPLTHWLILTIALR